MQGRELRGHFRWRLHELPFPVAQHTVPPASAGRARSSHPPSARFPRSDPGDRWTTGLLVLAFLTPFFTRDLSRSLSFSRVLYSLLHPPRPLAGAGPPMQRNFAQWRNLAITIAYPYSMVIPYCLYFSGSRYPIAADHSSCPAVPFVRPRVALCMSSSLPH